MEIDTIVVNIFAFIPFYLSVFSPMYLEFNVENVYIILAIDVGHNIQ